MKHFKNKKTNEIVGFENLEELNKFRKDFKDFKEITIAEVNLEIENSKPTEQKLKEKRTLIVSKINEHIEKQTNGYANAQSFRSYAGYPNEFQKEAIEFGEWTAKVWTKLRVLEETTTPQEIIEANVDDIINNLPKYTYKK